MPRFITIFATLHHRRSLLFEEGIKLLLNEGYPLVVQNTGTDAGFGCLGVSHPHLKTYDNNTQISYDMGMVKFKDILGSYEWDTVVFIDNDLFLTDLSYLRELIRDFTEGNYGYCSYFVYPEEYSPSYIFKNTIAEVEDLRIVPCPEYPFFKPIPYWENAMLLMSRDVWENLNKEDFSHGRLMFKGLLRIEAKLGVQRANHILHRYTHYGDGWFHLGNVMRYYYKIESKDVSELSPDSIVDKARLGYFVFQRNKYGSSIYTNTVNHNLNHLCDAIGGEQAVLEAWGKLVEGTCLG